MQEVAIRNNSAEAMPNWTVDFFFAHEPNVGGAWNASVGGVTETEGGYLVTVNSSNPLPAGGEVLMGFSGAHDAGFFFKQPICMAPSIDGTNPTDPNEPRPDVDAVEYRVDASGNITRNGTVQAIHCGNWFGLEGRHEPSGDVVNPSGAPMELYMGNTFWSNNMNGTGRTIQQAMDEIKGMGINTIRFPIVPQTLDADDPQGNFPFLKNHPDVAVENARLAMEEFIQLADDNDLDIILDIHSCSNYVGWRAGRLDARPPYVDRAREDYDFTREDYSCGAVADGSVTVHEYNQDMWLDDLREMAGLSELLKVNNIVGIDIYNEPWDYTWEQWKTMSELAFEVIDAVNPNLLIFIEGISASAGNQDGTPLTVTQVPHGDDFSNPNWGENFFEMAGNLPNIPKSRLVLSPHTYGPSVFVQQQFMDPTQPECAGLSGDEAGNADCNIVITPEVLRAGWKEHFGYLRDMGYAMVVGEFGGNMDWPSGTADQRDRNRWGHIDPADQVDAQWQDTFVDYMIDKNIQGCYWSINPESGDTGGWYGHAYDPISNTGGWGEWLDFDQRKTNLLQRLWGQ